MKLWIIFGSHHKTVIFSEVISIHFRAFLKFNVQNLNIYGELLNFNIFGGMPDIPDIFGGKH